MFAIFLTILAKSAFLYLASIISTVHLVAVRVEIGSYACQGGNYGAGTPTAARTCLSWFPSFC